MNKCRLGEISKVEWGNTSLTKKSFVDEGEFLAVSAAGADGRIGHSEHESHIPVISAIGANCGRMFFPTEPFTAIKNTMTVTPNYGNDSKFLYYFLSSIKMPKRGAAQPFLALKDIRNIQVPKYEVDQQIKIVSKLDQAFEAIDQAIANIDVVLLRINQLLQSYLKQNFNELNRVYDSVSLGNISTIQSGGTPKRSDKRYWYGNIAWYSSGELNQTFTLEPERHINQLAIEESNAKLFPKGSLLIGMYDTAALKMSILDRDAAFNQAIAGVFPNEKVSLKYIRLAISAQIEDLKKLRRGVRQKNLNLSKIKNIKIVLPPLSKQHIVLENIEQVEKTLSILRTNQEKKLKYLNELKMSILEKAFKGELV